MYEKVIKRLFDIVCSFLFIAVFWWVLLIIALKVKKKLGSPVLFRQPRPGMIDPKTGKERVFEMIKFRTMSDERDENGELLPNEERIDDFGRALRGTSLDELPEVFNILKGDMSIIGPRPQLVRDMVFMTEEQRVRHTAKPGLTGLAQVKGRNAISWEEKFEYDLEYVRNISFREDLDVFWKTVEKMILRKSSEVPDVEIDFAPDYGDDLLQKGMITREEYDAKQKEAEAILEEFRGAGK
ncbi:MAG: sugar transferase [Oscillospiraceae bacterium]|nr:sugar transferase [Oscillospiraceae bacterium]